MPEATLAELAADPANVEYLAQLREEVRTEERARVEAELAESAEKEQRHTALMSFAAEITSSTEDKPGLPIGEAEFVELAEGLDPEKEEKLKSMLTAIREKAAISFAEKGHSKPVSGQPLPEWAKASLQMWVDKGFEMSRWFAENSRELGAMDDYNLSEFEKKEK